MFSNIVKDHAEIEHSTVFDAEVSGAARVVNSQVALATIGDGAHLLDAKINPNLNSWPNLSQAKAFQRVVLGGEAAVVNSSVSYGATIKDHAAIVSSELCKGTLQGHARMANKADLDGYIIVDDNVKINGAMLRHPDKRKPVVLNGDYTIKSKPLRPGKRLAFDLGNLSASAVKPVDRYIKSGYGLNSGMGWQDPSL